ncbi:hypothetical protein KP509_17G022800 [Ceratopteris richardii]|nr:hypothetical protein KP509_17G022800 [Ceratopteris richardii]
MQDQRIIADKTENVWTILWEVLVQWLTLLFQLLIHAAEAVPAIKQVLEFSGLRPLYNPVSHNCQISAGSGLLPPRDSKDPNRLTVVLDLDETLVCAYESTGLPPLLHSQALRSGLKWFELQCVAIEKDNDGKSRVNHVTVYERPGLQEFLRRVSEFAEVVLFTAGLEGYASPLVDRIDPERRISARLYRPATVVS